MVRGLEKFREFFADVQSSYVLIGGAACDIWMERAGLSFRTTKDLDIVLVLSALDREFVERFNTFVRMGNYQNCQKSTGKRRYYRFFDPQDVSFPSMLELASRNPDNAIVPDGRRITAIPVDEDLSSLSAVLMDEVYYQLLMGERRVVDSLSIVSVAGLLCLKMHAWLKLTEKERTGSAVDSRDIKKHKNDVFRLFFALQTDSPIEIPEAVRLDIASYLTAINKEPWDIRELGKKCGITNPPSAERIIGELGVYFGIKVDPQRAKS